MHGTVSRGGSVTVAAYGKKTPKTIARDVNRLIEMDLVENGTQGNRSKQRNNPGLFAPAKEEGGGLKFRFDGTRAAPEAFGCSASKGIRSNRVFAVKIVAF